jgi:hypothetical protein
VAHAVATVQKRRGKWRVQIHRNGHAVSRTFNRKTDARDCARETEHCVDNENATSTRSLSPK